MFMWLRRLFSRFVYSTYGLYNAVNDGRSPPVIWGWASLVLLVWVFSSPYRLWHRLASLDMAAAVV